MAIYVSIVMYAVFYKNYIVDQFVYKLEVVITSPSFVALHLLVSEIAKCIA